MSMSTRRKNLTFANAPVDRATGEKLKVNQGEMESKALISLVILVDVSGMMSLSEDMRHRVTEE